MLRSMQAGPSISYAVAGLPLGPLRAALAGVPAYLVGGTVRDLLAGRPLDRDVDIAVDADLEAFLAGLDPDLPIEVEASHLRFGTATVAMDGLAVDLSRSRSETYPYPGALPEVLPAPIERDLARRDFSVNAMAVPLDSPAELIDPFEGATDLRAGILRVLHDSSFVDDPTRAIRAARYCSRLGLAPDPATRDLLRVCDLGTVSADRRRAELRLLAGEPRAAAGFGLLGEWRLLDLDAGALELIAAIGALALPAGLGGGEVARVEAIMAVIAEDERLRAAVALGRAEPERPSEAVRLAAGHSPAELLIAAASGGGWIGRLVEEWRPARLEIDGEDLIAAGVPEGPAIGVALRGALERKLDGGLDGGREAELELAVELARRAI